MNEENQGKNLMETGSGDMVLYGVIFPVTDSDNQWRSPPAQFAESYAKTTDTKLIITKSFSWMGAVYFEHQSVDGPLLNFDGSSSWNPHVWIVTDEVGVNNFYASMFYPEAVSLRHTTSLQTNTWYILAVSWDYDNSLISLWVDGELMTGPIPENLGSPNCGDTVYIGHW